MRKTWNIIIIVVCLLPFLFDITLAKGLTYKLKPEDLLITDFETPLNRFNGSVNSMGAIEGSGSTNEFAYSGKHSYKLVFAKDSMWKFEDKTGYGITGTGMKRTKGTMVTRKSKKITWAIFLMNMGPVVDSSKVPTLVESVDISGFRYLAFWVKGRRGGEEFRVYFRDVHAATYDPQVKTRPNVRVSREWRQVLVDLKKFQKKIDLENVTQVGIGFGIEDGSRPGSVFYIDNFVFIK